MTEANEIPVTERLTISLVVDTSTALAGLQARTGMKKVDLFNRAVQLYNLLDKAQRDGKTIYLRDGDDVQRVHIL